VCTTIIAGLTATKEKDIKKIVAMSTLSQLGIIIMITAISMKALAIVHTRTHALFKALLFITVGRIMLKKEGSQKKKMIRGRESKMSITAMKAAVVTLMRIPITSRFFSKDIMLELLISKRKKTEVLALIATATLTVRYSMTILKEITKRKKTSERIEKKGIKGEILLASSIIITRTFLTTSREITVNNISGTEKLT